MSETAENNELVSLALTDKQKEFLQLLENYRGNVTKACQAIGMHRSTFYGWLDKSDTLKDEVAVVRETAIDWVESKLMDNIEEGNVTAQIFYLKTIGRRRGYIEKFDLNLDAEADESTEITDFLKRGQARVEQMKADSDVVSEQ